MFGMVPSAGGKLRHPSGARNHEFCATGGVDTSAHMNDQPGFDASLDEKRFLQLMQEWRSRLLG